MKMRVLIPDDDRFSPEVLKEVLEMHNMGMTICHTLKRGAETRWLPVIMMSSCVRVGFS